MMHVVGVALLYRRTLVLVPLVLATLVVSIGLLKSREYTSSVSFVPQASKDDAGGAGALAAQFGLGVPGGDLTQTSDFYASLARSDQLLRAVVETPYQVVKDGDTTTENLITFYGKEGSFPAARAKAADDFRSAEVVTSDIKTGVVKIAVTTTNAKLSYQIVDRIVSLIMQFNAGTRRSQAHEERVFLEGRLRSAQSELRASEDRFQDFLQRNRVFQQYPTLVFEHDRLQREVVLRQQTLVQTDAKYELARAQEVRSTPVITIVERPFVPPRPDKRGLLVRAVLSVFVGLIVAAMYAFIREAKRDVAQFNSPSATLARTSWDAARDDLQVIAEKTGLAWLARKEIGGKPPSIS